MNISIRKYLMEYSEAKKLFKDEDYFSSPTTDQIISAGMDDIFDFPTIWYTADKNEDGKLVGYEEFKKAFCFKYLDRQPKAETFEMFKDRLYGDMLVFMDTYRQIYETTKLEYDPFVNRKYKQRIDETLKGSGKVGVNGNTSGNRQLDTTSKDIETNSSDTKDVYSGTENKTGNTSGETDTQRIDSDTPQINFAGTDYASAMTRGQDQTSGTSQEDLTQGSTRDVGVNGSRNIDGTGKSVENTTGTEFRNTDSENESERGNTLVYEGFVGSDMSDNLIKLREAIININEQIIDRLHHLFGFYFGSGVTFVSGSDVSSGRFGDYYGWDWYM